jgi:rRNA maturation RNase YbeY
MKSDPLITYRRKPASLDLVSLESFAEVLQKRVAGGREFHCLITGDAELQKLNQQFRGKDYPTDVLSFPALNAGETAQCHILFSEPDAGVGRTPGSAAGPLTGLVRKPGISGLPEEADRGVGRGLGSPPHKNYVAFGETACAATARVGQAFSPPIRDSIGDIAISLGRARAQAKEWKHTIEDELRILMLHGVLHLSGLDHETDSGEMKRTEMRWRKKFGLTNGLIERAEQ